MAERGRPTKYSEDVQKRADAYVAGGYIEAGDAVPTAAGLACLLDIAKSTIYEWAKHNPSFSDTLGRLNARQENSLTNGGLTGDFTPVITKLMLANHGYSEKVETVTEHKITGFEVVADEG